MSDEPTIVVWQPRAYLFGGGDMQVVDGLEVSMQNSGLVQLILPSLPTT